MPPKPRQRFEHNGVLIYEWEQSLEEVLVYVRPPPGVKAAQISCTIKPRHLTLGIKGLPPFLDEPLSSTCIERDSLWSFEDGELTLTLAKASKGATWGSVCVGHGALDGDSEKEVHKTMLLERFGQEHPQFDFSGADVTGSVPDPKEFMGGMS